MAALLLSEVVSNAVRHADGPAIEIAGGYDHRVRVVTGAVFDTNPGMGAGARSSRDEADTEETELETGRGPATRETSTPMAGILIRVGGGQRPGSGAGVVPAGPGGGPREQWCGLR
ncbi:hypothetical protein AB0B13_21385, partial [Streptomyces sp. NPDC042898]